jgi:hypothetical protein
MMLKGDSSTQMDQNNKAVLKLQSAKNGLVIDLSAASVPSQTCSLYLFDAEGNDHFAGDIKEGGLHTELGPLLLDSIAGAAVIDAKTLSFLLKSSGPNWTEIAARFKFKYALPKPEIKRQQPEEIKLPPQSNEQNQIPQKPQLEAQPRICDTCPHVIRQDKINPFPSAYPNSEWVKISYPGPTGWWHYISGKIRSGDTVIVKVLGVPGEYGMAPPIWLEGFGTYMRSASLDAAGYWLMFQDAETGEVLDMGLSPHGG